MELICARCEYVKCTLSLEGVQVVSEGVCWFSLLQDTQVAQFLHLRFLRLPLPHRHHDLKKNNSKISQMPPQHWRRELKKKTSNLEKKKITGWKKKQTLTLRVLTGSLSRETVRGKITSSVRTTGSSRGDWWGQTESNTMVIFFLYTLISSY